MRVSLIAQLVKNLQCRRPWFNLWVGKIHWRRDRLPTPVFSGFPCGSAGKEFVCNAGDLGSIPGLGRSPEEGKGYPLLYSGLENSMDCIIHGVTKIRTQLSDFLYIYIYTTSSFICQWTIELLPCLGYCKWYWCTGVYYVMLCYAKSLQSCPTLCDPIDGSHQAPPSLGFSRQEHWSGLPFPPPMHESEK